MAVKKDLSQVKDYWIKHNITYKAVADMFSVSVETVRKRAYKEKWEEQKILYTSSLMANKEEPEEYITDLEEIKQLELKAIGKSLKLINVGLSDTLPADTNRLKTLTGALSDTHKIILDFENKQDTNKETYEKLNYVLSQIKGNI